MTTGLNQGLAAAAIELIMGRAVVSGHGQYHTANPAAKNPRPYLSITLGEIVKMAGTPPSVAKENAQWAIFSTTGGPKARVFEFQLENGVFWALWADIDEVNGLSFEAVVDLIRQALPGIWTLIYNSRSATADNPKCRIIIPLIEAIPGRDYPLYAKILNDRLEAAGLPPDRATEGTAQLCYLPNRGEFYRHQIIDDEILNPSVYFAAEIQAERERLAREKVLRDARHQEALLKVQERIDTGQADPMAAFKAAYPVETALERYGYTLRGHKWLSPRSESGNPGVSVKDGKWFSHHASDAGIGQPAQGGGTWGDAFDLFIYYEHGGNFDQALKAAGELFTTTDPLTGETVTITKLNQRQRMRGKDTGADPGADFQGPSTGNQAGSDKPDTWEPVIPLDALEVDSLDPDTLPGIIGEYARAVARETETPLELAAGTLFVALATCVQGRVRVQVKPGYSEPLAFWTVIPMDPGTRKSQVLKRVTAPLTEWEKRQRIGLEPLIKARRIERENIQARIKHLRGKYGKAKADELQGIEDEIKSLEDRMPSEIFTPQLWAQDITPENAGMIMARNDERLTILSAEGGPLDTLGGRYSSGIPNLDLYLQGYSGDFVRVNRVNREDVHLNNPALSLGLLPQPQVIKGSLSKAEFKGRGFVGRGLYFMSPSNLGTRTLNTVPIPEHIKIAYTRTIETLLEIQPLEHPDGTTGPHTLTLSPEAFKEWSDFYMVVERNMADGGRFEHCRDWAGKTPGRAARLAALFHCAVYPEAPWRVPLELEIMEMALDVTEVSISHALAVFNLMGADPAIEGAGRVLKWITRNQHRTFTKKLAFDGLRGTFTRADMLDEPLAVLTERNYIRAIIEKEKKPGRKSEGFEVNPSVVGVNDGLA